MTMKKLENGNKVWFNKDNKIHREDGPAIEYANGDKEWFLNGMLHREDGPAAEYINGYKSWWLNNKPLTENEFNTIIFANLPKDSFNL